MTNPVYIDLPPDQANKITAALNDALRDNVAADIRVDGVTARNGDVLVPVIPRAYPDRMFDFMEAVATAEIRLRDSGMQVRLVPDIRQREVVVAWGAGHPKIAFLSTDGEEVSDFAQILELTEADLSAATYDGYAYDSSVDLPEAISDAKREHPGADFSRVPLPQDRLGK